MCDNYLLKCIFSVTCCRSQTPGAAPQKCQCHDTSRPPPYTSTSCGGNRIMTECNAERGIVIKEGAPRHVNNPYWPHRTWGEHHERTVRQAHINHPVRRGKKQQPLPRQQVIIIISLQSKCSFATTMADRYSFQVTAEFFLLAQISYCILT